MYLDKEFWVCQRAIVGYFVNIYEKLLKQYYVGYSALIQLFLWERSSDSSDLEKNLG